jgi:hypothetical protein
MLKEASDIKIIQIKNKVKWPNEEGYRENSQENEIRGREAVA